MILKLQIDLKKLLDIPSSNIGMANECTTYYLTYSDNFLLNISWSFSSTSYWKYHTCHLLTYLVHKIISSCHLWSLLITFASCNNLQCVKLNTNHVVQQLVCNAGWLKLHKYSFLSSPLLWWYYTQPTMNTSNTFTLYFIWGKIRCFRLSYKPHWKGWNHKKNLS